MARAELELMINVTNGRKLLEDDPEVRITPRLWVRFKDGDRAIWSRQQELEAETVVAQKEIAAAARAHAIAVGSRALASDDANAAAAKKAARDNSDLELVYEDNGTVLGARLKERAARPA